MQVRVQRVVTRVGGMFLAVVATAAAAGRASAAEGPNLTFTIAGLRLGQQVSGLPCPPESLAHRPVLLEFWGIHCPPCLKSMPKLEELHRGLGPQGLVIIGAHAQEGSAAEIRAAVTQLGVTFPIVDQATVEGGMDFDGIPHCMLFDHTGRCVYRGSPFEVHDAAVAVVKAAPGAVLQGRTLEKLTAFNELVRNERQFGVALKKAKGLTASKNADMAAEAEFVVERLEMRGKELLDEADARKADDPLAAVETLQRCAAAFKGSEIGIDADKRLKAWKKEADFRAAVTAAAMERGRSTR
jgi:thiol-disulfide isomerase/thioredoxin